MSVRIPRSSSVTVATATRSLASNSNAPSADGSGVGHLLMVRNTLLMAQPFDEQRLQLRDEPATIAEQVGRVGEHLVAVENTPQRHNMIVCTLCSCYPTDVLGLPPTWYKSFPYRSRVVKDPRGVLADFGVTLPAETEIRVWDSTAETRYMVVPMRPAGTEGWSEERLAKLVTRDSMVGTGLAKNPGEVA